MTGRRAIHGASHDTSTSPRSSAVDAPSAAAVLSHLGLVCVSKGVGQPTVIATLNPSRNRGQTPDVQCGLPTAVRTVAPGLRAS